MIYKYISIYNILEKLFRDNGINSEVNWEDCIEWAGEALDKIGAYQQYIRKVTGDKENPCLDITDFKAKLPCDFHALEQIAVNGYAAKYAGNTFHHLKDGCACTVQDNTKDDLTLFPDNFGNEFMVNAGTKDVGFMQGYTYDINDNFLTLNARTGKVCIAYLAIPVDADGFPMIPDDISYREAITKYITMKLDYIQWRSGKAADKLFAHSEREWLWYCAQAKGKASMPSLEKLESIKKQWVKLIPGLSQEKVFFK